MAAGCNPSVNTQQDILRKNPLSEGVDVSAKRPVGETTQSAPPECAISLFDGNSLGEWIPTDFVGSGAVRIEDGSIILEKGWELTGVTWTGQLLRNDYEICLEAMRVDGEDFFCGLTFPVGEDCCTLIVGGWRGKVVGLSSIDLMDAAENQTTVLLDFEKGRWCRIRLCVTSQRIQAWIDGSRVIDADIQGRILSVRHEVERSRPLGIASWKTTAAIRNICIKGL